jgi:uncharacterized membrane protein YdjX (TVP38/TMEM64 family)
VRAEARIYAALVPEPQPVPEPPAAAPLGRRLAALRIVVLSLLVVCTAVFWLSGWAPSADEMRDWGDDLGAAAPLVWPPLFALVNFLVPWPVIAAATGLIFGTAAGTALALAGVLLASSLSYTIARHVAGEALRARVLRRMPRIDAMLERNGFLAVFYSRLVPGVPWGLVNYAAGIARVRLRDLLTATVVAGTPKIYAYVALGGNLDDLSRPEAIVAISLWVALAIVGLFVARRQFRAA